MIELFLGALDLSPYYRNIESDSNGFRLYLRDTPEDIHKSLMLFVRNRSRISLYYNVDYRLPLQAEKNPVMLYRLQIIPLGYTDVGRPLFERKNYPHLPTHLLEGLFHDSIPF